MATALHLSPKPVPIFALSPKFLSPIPSTNPQLHLLHNRPFIHRFRIPFSSFRNGSPPETECPVPQDQQPINEYQSLSSSFPFSWASCDIVEYASRLFATGATFALFIGLPVSWFGSVGAESEPLKRVLCAASSGLFAVTLAVLRMYLGWAYVGNRLLSATVEFCHFIAMFNCIFSISTIHNYGKNLNNIKHSRHSHCHANESGANGTIWVKTAEILARDRLLGSFSVKPVLGRLKYTLVGLGTTLFICALILINIDGNQNGSYMTSKEGGIRVIPGAYNDDSARSFEPDAFCGGGDSGEPDIQL